ncbi:hypodermin-B-like [Lucilia cuprina]|uniref:hypodermin-B-like n=1 Tax=Lucilia cuprina TaxID=7375 RepID=UPI001F062351|nr:hypodermin-B-like [Lucilia cuprina]
MLQFLLTLIITSCYFHLNSAVINFAEDEQFPFEVVIEADGLDICGGAIISKFTIITAAHCIDVLDSNYIKIIAGRHNFEVTPVEHEVDNTALHPLYNKKNREFDVALIKLLQPLDLSLSNVDFIEIATSSYSFDAGTKGTLVYWELGKGAMLYYTEVEFWQQDTCLNFVTEIYSNMSPARNAIICTSIPEGSCIDDQAGSLIVNDELWGLVSWHLDCDSEYKPLVFTNLVFVKNWINENTRHN